MHERLPATTHPRRQVEGVRNLSASQHSGQMWITNVRLVWTAANPHAYNISVPLVQVSACELRDSKAGHAIVLEVHKLSGGYKLGACSNGRLCSCGWTHLKKQPTS